MAATTKRVLLWLGVAFVVYTIIESPAKAADLVQAAFGGIERRGPEPGHVLRRPRALSSWTPAASAAWSATCSRASAGSSPYAGTGPAWRDRRWLPWAAWSR